MARHDLNLLPHQENGVFFLAQRDAALLWDEAGTGKTATAVRAAARAGHRRVLVLCPATVRNAWAMEVAKWWPGDVPAVAVVEGRDGPFLPEGAPGWTVMSHQALVSKDVTGRLWSGGDWDLLVVDEHSEFRRFEAKRTRNLLGDGGLWSLCRAVWMLDGDPVVNSAMDLYPAFYGPLRRHLGTPPEAWSFGLQYSNWVENGLGFRAQGVRNEAELVGRLRPFVMRRTLASAGIDLPMLDVRRVQVPWDPAYGAEVAAALAGWDSPAKRAELESMLQDRDDVRDADLARARRALGLAKVQGAVERVCGAAFDGPVVLFFQHTQVRREVGDRLKALGARIAWIDGIVTRRAAVEAQDAFAAGTVDCLLVQTQAGGRGLTLTRSNRVVVAEMPWTAVALHQAIKRVHRMTQVRDVTAEVLLAEGQWLDAMMAGTVRRKDESARRLMELLTT